MPLEIDTWDSGERESRTGKERTSTPRGRGTCGTQASPASVCVCVCVSVFSVFFLFFGWTSRRATVTPVVQFLTQKKPEKPKIYKKKIKILPENTASTPPP